MIAPIGTGHNGCSQCAARPKILWCYGRGSGMRHFLIITCLAALAWAVVPVCVALAQADFPTVESEVEPSLQPDEAGPGATAPLEEGGFKTEQNDKEPKESGDEAEVSAALPLGDPLTILRLSVIPIFIWVIKNLISYSFLRRHVTRAIYVDIEYRMRFTELFIKSTKDWIEHYEPYKDRVPFLRVGREDHHMYANIQSDLRECTWGEEVAAVRLIYRSFDEVERAADRIRQTYSDLLALSREKSLAMKRDTAIGLRQRMKDQIAAEVGRIEGCLAFGRKLARKQKRTCQGKMIRKAIVGALYGLYVGSCTAVKFGTLYVHFYLPAYWPRWVRLSSFLRCRSIRAFSWGWRFCCQCGEEACISFLGRKTKFEFGKLS